MTRRWPNFTEAELSCHGTGECKMNDEFMDRLQALRDAFGVPMRISSAYRSPAYNAQVSSTGTDGPHTTGRAVDVLISGPQAVRLVGLALGLGFTGIGVSQKGPHEKRFVHLDDLETGRPTMWSY